MTKHIIVSDKAHFWLHETKLKCGYDSIKDIIDSLIFSDKEEWKTPRSP